MEVVVLEWGVYSLVVVAGTGMPILFCYGLEAVPHVEEYHAQNILEEVRVLGVWMVKTFQFVVHSGLHSLPYYYRPHWDQIYIL